MAGNTERGLWSRKSWQCTGAKTVCKSIANLLWCHGNYLWCASAGTSEVHQIGLMLVFKYQADLTKSRVHRQQKVKEPGQVRQHN